MLLTRLTAHGFRRFADPTWVNLDGRVTAIVGPNDSGKSSFLEGLMALNHQRPFARSDLTRGATFPPSRPVLTARFWIEPEDRKGLRGVDAARWFEVEKAADGTIQTRLRPPLERDVRDHRDAAAALERFMATATFRSLRHPVGTDFRSYVRRTTDDLCTSNGPLTLEQIQDLEVVIDVLEHAARAPGAGSSDAEESLGAVRNLIAVERSEAGDHDARVALWKKMPLFVLFGHEHRDLAAEYDLRDLATADPPEALSNLAALAGLHLNELLRAVLEEDTARAATLCDSANRTLRETFDSAWPGSKLSVQFFPAGSVLRILARDSAGVFTSVAEHSAGVRAFVALIAFTTLRNRGRDVILLVDEAEQHLHYDAQANLVRVFATQQAARQIVYTTHSAGCLPSDLGSGVRLVKQASEVRSVFVNHYWSEGPGLEPLLMGMGASMLAFTPARFAVVAEGATEAVLLPSLLRDAVGVSEIPFQVVPGAAEVPPSAVPTLELEALRVCYLLDGDEGGSHHRRKLLAAGVPESRVLLLRDGSCGLTVEDLVHEDILERAVLRELERRGRKLSSPLVIPRSMRSQAIAAQLREAQIPPLNKVAVAHHVLDLAREGNLIQPEVAPALKQMYEEICRVLGVTEASVTREDNS